MTTQRMLRYHHAEGVSWKSGDATDYVANLAPLPILPLAQGWTPPPPHTHTHTLSVNLLVQMSVGTVVLSSHPFHLLMIISYV